MIKRIPGAAAPGIEDTYMQKWNWKQTVVSITTVFLMTALILLVFHGQWDAICSSLATVSLGNLGVIILLGLLSTFFDALAHWTMIRTALSGFSVRNSVELLYLGFFSNVATLAAGTVPLQSYHLYRHGMAAGAGAGTILVEYTFHKSMVLVYAGVMLLLGSRWLTFGDTSYAEYLTAGYIIAIAIIVFLALICCSRRVQRLVCQLIARIPERGNWIRRKQLWQAQMNVLGEQSRQILGNRRICLCAILFTALKLFVLYSIPFVCLRVLGVEALTYGQAHLLTALMLLLTGAIPNIGGMGPTEAAFLLLFTPFVESAPALSALILYRIGTYYVPFLLGVAVFLHWQKALTSSEKGAQ